MSNATILIIEDNLINQQLISHYLVGEGYCVDKASTGEVGIDLAEQKQPELILLDVMMPGINGFETARRLKANPRTSQIPIIYISALDHVEDKLAGFEAGGVDYITKPFSASEILARVRTHLKLYALQRELAAKNDALEAANDKISELNNQLYKLFGQFATQPVADELLAHGLTLGGNYVNATAMFCDIRDFTRITEQQGPEATIQLLNDYFSHMFEAIGQEGGVVNQMVGDGLMAIFGAPVPHADHAERAVRAALLMRQRIKLFNKEQIAHGRAPIEIGIGIASGQVIAGYLGTNARATYTCVGDTVNIAARLEAYTKYVPYRVLLDANTRRALGQEVRVHIKDLGIRQFRGKIEAINVYALLTGSTSTVKVPHDSPALSHFV